MIMTDDDVYTKYTYYKSDNWPFKVRVSDHRADRFNDVIAWCTQHLGNEYVHWKMTIESDTPLHWKCMYHFRSNENAALFALTWS